jgi:uncharacterized protein (DUF4415 family)
MTKTGNARGTRPDAENPAWTRAAVAAARPALEVLGKVFGAGAEAKINQTLRLNAAMVAAFRAQGRGWQAWMNAVLRQPMPARES